MHLLEVTGKGRGGNDFPTCPLANDPVPALTDALLYSRGEKDTFAFHRGYSAYQAKEGSDFPFNQISIIPSEE